MESVNYINNNLFLVQSFSFSAKRPSIYVQCNFRILVALFFIEYFLVISRSKRTKKQNARIIQSKLYKIGQEP